MASPAEPVNAVRVYRGRDRVCISLPVGGIGTGTVGFGGRGQLRDWEIENRPAKGQLAPLTFLACRVAGQGTPTVARILEGALFNEEIGGEQGSPAPLAGLPRFADCEFEAAYPFGRVLLSDPAVPLRAEVEAWNPLIPGDEDASGLPLAIFEVTITSLASEPLDLSLLLSVEAFPGHRARGSGAPSAPTVSAMPPGAGVTGLQLADAQLGRLDEDYGTLAAAVLDDGSSDGSGDGWIGPEWAYGMWNQGLFGMWRSFAETGRPVAGNWRRGPRPAADLGSGAALAGTLGTSQVLPPGGTAHVTFVLAWHFPNRRAWVWSGPGPRCGSGDDIVGNYYATGYRDAWDAVTASARLLPALRQSTERFVSAFRASDLSPAVKEAALFNISTLRSQTFFRTADGTPFGWEGCLDDAGSCLGSCTHVWNYDQATGFLFGGLARRMREVEYLHATGPDGAMSFRVMLPLDRARERPDVAADGQFGCVLKVYREWRLCGDDAWLRSLWPACRRSIEFAWVPGGWDADRDGLAEGAQHNTTDVEYYGPTPVIQGWYLAALAAGAALADAVGDASFAATCREVLSSGQRLTEERLFNGRYYRQEIIPPGNFDSVAPRLRSPGMGAQRADDPEFQIGDGCITDQLIGDTYARLVGLGPVFDDKNADLALRAIHSYNYVEDFGALTNYIRAYAVTGERGHVVMSYPDGLPEHPMPYFSEVWTGLEYVYAIGLLQAGFFDLASDVVAAARSRFSGSRRNPFDEAECGHHYARALASWGLVVAATGFGYDARTGVMTFARADRPVRWFWSTGSAWGLVTQSPGTDPQLEVLHGNIRVTRIDLRLGAAAPACRPRDDTLVTQAPMRSTSMSRLAQTCSSSAV